MGMKICKMGSVQISNVLINHLAVAMATAMVTTHHVFAMQALPDLTVSLILMVRNHMMI